MREPARWSNQWLREMPWRELIKLRQVIAALGVPIHGMIRSRCLRIESEWDRRKREGGGGLIAEMIRKGEITK